MHTWTGELDAAASVLVSRWLVLRACAARLRCALALRMCAGFTALSQPEVGLASLLWDAASRLSTRPQSCSSEELGNVPVSDWVPEQASGRKHNTSVVLESRHAAWQLGAQILG